MDVKVKKIVGWIMLVGILFILTSFLIGFKITSFGEIVSVFVVYFISCLLFMVIPCIFRVRNKRKLLYRKGLRVCGLNSIVLFALVAIPNIIKIINTKEGSPDIMSIDPIVFSQQIIIVGFILSVLFFFINLCFFVDKKND